MKTNLFKVIPTGRRGCAERRGDCARNQAPAHFAENVVAEATKLSPLNRGIGGAHSYVAYDYHR